LLSTRKIGNFSLKIKTSKNFNHPHTFSELEGKQKALETTRQRNAKAKQRTEENKKKGSTERVKGNKTFKNIAFSELHARHFRHKTYKF